MLYMPPSGATDANASYIGKNVVAGIQGSKVPKSAIEAPQRELVNLINLSGQIPSASDLYQVARAIQSGQVSCAIASGANTLQATLIPAPTSLPDGMIVHLWCPSTNTGTVSFKPNGMNGSVVLRKTGGSFQAGDIPPGGSWLSIIRKDSNWYSLSLVLSEVVANILGTPGSYSLLNPDRLHLRATRSASTSPLALGAGWNTWPLNTLVKNEISGASFNPTTKIIGLPAGIFWMTYQCYVNNGKAHQARVFNVDDGVVMDSGCNGDTYGDVGNTSNTGPSSGEFDFTLTAPKQIRVEHADLAASIASYFGDDVTGYSKVDAIIRIYKLKGIA